MSQCDHAAQSPTRPDVQPCFSDYAELPLISISDIQRRPIPDANGWLPSITEIPETCTHFATLPMITSRSSAASRRRSDWIALSRSLVAPA